jgi:hypothetical protein
LLHRSTEDDPYGSGEEAKPAEHKECRREADPLRDPSSERRAEGRARALDRNDRTLREIDATGSVQRARHHAWHRDALQADTDAVQDLDRSDPCVCRNLDSAILMVKAAKDRS